MILTCPDPSMMAYDGWEISDTQGIQPDPDGKGLIPCGREWRPDNCDCNTNEVCKPARIRHKEGMTILGGEEGWGTYRDSCRYGGYVAAGDHAEVAISRR